MFFQRPASQSPESSNSASISDQQQTIANATQRRSVRSRTRRRQLAAMGLAIAMTTPFGAVKLAHLYAQTAAPADNNGATPMLGFEEPKLSSADLLKRGINEYKNEQYEEAQATLQQVKPDELASDADRKSLADSLAKAESAANERRAARASFEKGDEALKNNQPADAIAAYKAAANNKFVDEGTKQKAQEQIAVAEAAQGKVAADNKTVYSQAVSDYKAGNYADAKSKFEQLQSSGYKAGLFQKSPGDYLKDIDKKMAAQPAPAGDAAAAAGGAASGAAAGGAAAAAADQTSAKDYYNKGRDEYRKGDWVAARQDLNKAVEGGYKPGLFEEKPESYLSKMDAKEQADAAKSAQAAAAQAQSEADAKAQAENAAKMQSDQEAQAKKDAEAKAAADSAAADQAKKDADAKAAADAAAQDQAKKDAAAKAAADATAADQAKKDAEVKATADAAAQDQAKKDADAKAAAEAAAAAAATDQAKKDSDAKAAQEAVVASEAASAAQRKTDAKAAYNLARDQYRSGDWIAARQNFNKAHDLGYKPGLFEDSPEKYLAKMDAKEQADAIKSAQLAEKQRAEADAQAAAAAAAAKPAVAAAEPAPATAPAAAAEVKPETSAASATETKTETKTETVAPAAAATAAPVDDHARAQAELEKNAPMSQAAKEQRARMAQQLVEEGRAAQNANDYSHALELYTNALEYDPTNQQAAAGRNEMLNLTGRGPTSPMTDIERRIRERRSTINAKFDAAIEDTNTAISSNKFQAAKESLDRARIAAGQDPTVFTADEIREFNTRIANAQTALDNAQQTFTAEQTKDAAKQALVQSQQRAAEAQRQKEQTISTLIANAQQLVREQRYKEALGVLDQIQLLDPKNDYAIGVRPLIQDRYNFAEQRRFRETFDQEFTKQLNQAEEKKIPYDEILRYPANWPDISEMREQTTQSERGVKQEDQAVQAQLDRRLPEVNFNAVGFTDVVDFLRDVSGANIFVNWRALEQAGVDRNAPVTARLRDVKFSKALSTILSDVGGGTVKLSYTIDEGVITISTEEDLSKNTVTRVYDIRDLIVNVPEFDTAPDFNLQSSSSSSGGRRGGSGGGGGGGGSSGSLFGGGGGGGSNEETGATRTELVDSIIKLITDTVAPDSWRDAGGSVGSVRELSGQLIVTQTPENQRQLVALLEQLRETRAIQVTIETRFLTVQRNFLEDIGVDVDWVFNANGSISNNLSRIPVTNGTADFTQNPSTAVPGSLASQTSSGVTGLSVAGTFMDDFTVSFLIRATQAETNSTLLTAPRVTLFNGQRAYVLVATQTAYVSDLSPVVGAGSTAFDPTVDIVESGVLLDVQATVSSDRKYVTLTLRPQLSTLLSLVPFAFQTSVATTATGTGGNTTVISTGDQAGVATGIIQQPIIQITEVRTTVSVPDGGTLLLGGQTLAGEIEKEAGVPVLSKIPFLKRLFTNRSTAKDEQILLILVRPTIIIQREQEQRQFPLLTSKVSGG